MALEAVEALEGWESESEAAEARTVRRPSSQPSFRPRPAPSAPQYVTQAQLEASLTRVDGKVKTVADGVATINTRLNSQATSLKKESEERKKTGETQNKDLNQKLQLLALLPLLTPSPSKKLDAATPLQSGGQPITSVSVPDANQLDALLPLLLVSGLGGSGGLGLGGDSSPGSDGGGLLLLALVLAFANRQS